MSSGCGGHKCENQAFYGLPSPDGASIAFIFHRRCAATGNASTTTTDVSLLDFHSSLRNEPGNVLSVPGEQPVHVTWLGPQQLLIKGFHAPVVTHHQQVGSYTIVLQPPLDK